jgi:hypothetical protein
VQGPVDRAVRGQSGERPGTERHRPRCAVSSPGRTCPKMRLGLRGAGGALSCVSVNIYIILPVVEERRCSRPPSSWSSPHSSQARAGAAAGGDGRRQPSRVQTFRRAPGLLDVGARGAVAVRAVVGTWRGNGGHVVLRQAHGLRGPENAGARRRVAVGSSPTPAGRPRRWAWCSERGAPRADAVLTTPHQIKVRYLQNGGEGLARLERGVSCAVHTGVLWGDVAVQPAGIPPRRRRTASSSPRRPGACARAERARGYDHAPPPRHVGGDPGPRRGRVCRPTIDGGGVAGGAA